MLRGNNRYVVKSPAKSIPLNGIMGIQRETIRQFPVNGGFPATAPFEAAICVNSAFFSQNPSGGLSLAFGEAPAADERFQRLDPVFI
jgi:hypothetical protein